MLKVFETRRRERARVAGVLASAEHALSISQIAHRAHVAPMWVVSAIDYLRVRELITRDWDPSGAEWDSDTRKSVYYRTEGSAARLGEISENLTWRQRRQRRALARVASALLDASEPIGLYALGRTTRMRTIRVVRAVDALMKYGWISDGWLTDGRRVYGVTESGKDQLSQLRMLV